MDTATPTTTSASNGTDIVMSPVTFPPSNGNNGNNGNSGSTDSKSSGGKKKKEKIPSQSFQTRYFNYHPSCFASIATNVPKDEEMFFGVAETTRVDKVNVARGIYLREATQHGDKVTYTYKWVCRYFRLEAFCRDSDGRWDAIVSGPDADNNWIDVSLPFSERCKQSEFLRNLSTAIAWETSGIHGANMPSLLNYIFEYGQRPNSGIPCYTNVTRTGWSEDGDAEVYTLPGGIYGDAVIKPTVCHDKALTKLYSTAGSLESWQAVPKMARNNPVLMMALCTSFVGPIARRMDISGGVHLIGRSSRGKTTAMRGAASVWGPPTRVKSWRGTDNGLESIAMAHNDSTMYLDEVGQASAKVLNEVIYMLANGSGKIRASRAGGTRSTAEWKTFFLSTGECSMASKFSEAGGTLKVRAGQEVRCLELHTDDIGIAQNIHDEESSETFVRKYGRLSSEHYGQAGVEYIKYLVSLTPADWLAAQDRHKDLSAALRDGIQGMDGQVERVASSFAALALAGEMGIAAGVLPWTWEEFFDAISACYTSWISTRGGAGAAEDRETAKHVRGTLESRGFSNFIAISKETSGPQYTINGDFTPSDLWGYSHVDPSGKLAFYVFKGAFEKHFCNGQDPRRTLAILHEQDFLQRPQAQRNATSLKVHGETYSVYKLMLPDDSDDDGGSTPPPAERKTLSAPEWAMETPLSDDVSTDEVSVSDAGGCLSDSAKAPNAEAPIKRFFYTPSHLRHSLETCDTSMDAYATLSLLGLVGVGYNKDVGWDKEGLKTIPPDYVEAFGTESQLLESLNRLSAAAFPSTSSEVEVLS